MMHFFFFLQKEDGIKPSYSHFKRDCESGSKTAQSRGVQLFRSEHSEKLQESTGRSIKLAENCIPYLEE